MHTLHPARAAPPRPVTRPVMHQRWADLTYVHWPVAPAVVAELLPPRLNPDVYDHAAWVGLVPFRMEDIRLPGLPPVPYLGTFPETNIRTYVTGPAGPGVWFHSLDISRLLPVLVARATYRLPYMWAQMDIERTPGLIRYRAHRRWPRPAVSSDVAIEIGAPIGAPDDLDHFLSARWGLYTMLRHRLAYAPVEHEPWPLHEARLVGLVDELAAAAGYDVTSRPAHVRFSPGVSVRIGRPRIVR